MRTLSLAVKRLLPSLVAVAVLVLMTTFAGMAIFGMESGMAMEHGMSDMACVNHCLSALPSTVPAATPFLASLLAVLTVILLSGPSVDEAWLARPVGRRLSDIGKFLLHQNLSVVVLRN